MARKAIIRRKTNETEIRLKPESGRPGQSTHLYRDRFFDHMLELVARHGGFDLQIAARGDLDVDQHHTVEDVGIAHRRGGAEGVWGISAAFCAPDIL